MTTIGDAGKAMAEAMAKANPFGESKLRPGEGPSKDEREAGFFDILFIGEYPDGTTIRASVQGDRDPGYGSTSKMLAETGMRSEEHTSELQSLMRISYADFCLKKQNKDKQTSNIKN